MNVFFRVDASVQIGSGHVMRCLSLAEQLLDKGAKCTFICRELQGNMIDFISKKFPVKILPAIDTIDEWQWMSDNWKKDVTRTISYLKETIDLLIIDHYSLENKWEKAIRPFVKKIMVIDDLANRIHDCDLLLDQNYYLDMENRYKNLVPISCQQVLGPNYILLREEFFEIVQQPKVKNKIPRIFVFFGGSDPTNDTLRCINVLQKLKEDIQFEVDVVVGAVYRNKKLVQKICEAESYLNYYEQISNIAELMARADLAIGAGGTTVWERGFLSVPSIVISLAMNQVEGAKALDVKNAILYLGHYDKIDLNNYARQIKNLITSVNHREILVNSFNKIMNQQQVRNKILLNQILNII